MCLGCIKVCFIFWFYWYALKLLSLFWSRWSRWSRCARCPRWNSVSCGIVKAVRYEGIWSDHHEDVFFVLFCIVFCLGEMFTDRALEEGGGGRMCRFFVRDWVCWYDEEVVVFPSVRPSFHRCLFGNVGSEKTKCKYLCEFDTVWIWVILFL